MGGSVAPCTLGVRFRKHTCQFQTHGKHSGASGIFVHLLYGSVQLRDLCTVEARLAVYRNLRGPAAPCLLGVRFRIWPSLFTMPLEALWRKRHFRTPAVRLCTFLGPGSVEEPLAVYANLGGPVVPCTLGVRFQKRTCQFTRPWEALWRKRHLRTPAARLYTFPRPGLQVPLIVYTNLGCPAAPWTLGVRFRKWSRLFTRPWEAVWCKEHFRTPAVRLYTAPGPVPRRSATSCVHKSGRSRGTSYTRCMIPKTHMPFHQAMGSTLVQTAFSYTRITCLYFAGPGPVQVPLAMYSNLGGAMAPCTLGVRFRKRTCQFTRQWEALWHKRNLHTPAVWLCTALGRGPVKVLLAVYINLGGPAVPCTLGVKFRKRTRQCTGP